MRKSSRIAALLLCAAVAALIPAAVSALASVSGCTFGQY
jgi:hypothetical protein